MTVADLPFEVADEDLPGTYTWQKGMEACEQLGDGWRMPTKEELNTLYEHKKGIGGFAATNYWSSSEYFAYVAWVQYFNYGDQYMYSKNVDYRVRAVRNRMARMTIADIQNIPHGRCLRIPAGDRGMAEIWRLHAVYVLFEESAYSTGPVYAGVYNDADEVAKAIRIWSGE